MLLDFLNNSVLLALHLSVLLHLLLTHLSVILLRSVFLLDSKGYCISFRVAALLSISGQIVLLIHFTMLEVVVILSVLLLRQLYSLRSV